MSENLDELLEIRGTKPPAAVTVVPVTVLARICQVLGCLCMLAALASFIPGSKDDFFGVTAVFMLSLLALIVLGALTLLFALVALLRVWLSSRKVKGVRQVFASLALLALSIALFVVCGLTM